MSEQGTPPPAKPKPGSLRDRIAAFESKPAGSGSPAPTPRPKPGNIQWKPKAASPPSSPPANDKPNNLGPERKYGTAGSMSASDAKESIGKGGSLKERMAALQGRGAFGAPAVTPPPKPASEKPKWKPPTAVTSPAKEQDESQGGAEDKLESEPVESTENHSVDEQDKIAEENDGETEADPEEEERHRRAAIAARMARLGGARLGMAPPVFGRKPEMKRAEPPKSDGEKPRQDSGDEKTSYSEVTSPSGLGSVKSQKVETPESESAVLEQSGLMSADSAQVAKEHSQGSLSPSDYISIKSSRSPPTSMPAPAVPRRAAPPRKKSVKSPSPSSSEVLEDASQLHESPANTPALGSIEEILTKPESLVSEQSSIVQDQDQDTDIKVFESDNRDEVSELRPPSPSEQPAHVDVTDIVTDEPLPPAVTGNVTENTMEIKSVGQLKPDSGGPEAYIEDVVSPPSPVSANIVHDEPEEEDEVTRRKRIAERIAKAGGLNPFTAPPPPQRRPSLVSPDTASPLSSHASGDIDDTVSPALSPAFERKSSLRQGSVDSMPGTGVAYPQSSIHANVSSPSSSEAGRKTSLRQSSTSSGILSRSPESPTSPRKEGNIGRANAVDETQDDRSVTDRFAGMVPSHEPRKEATNRYKVEEAEAPHRRGEHESDVTYDADYNTARPKRLKEGLDEREPSVEDLQGFQEQDGQDEGDNLDVGEDKDEHIVARPGVKRSLSPVPAPAAEIFRSVPAATQDEQISEHQGTTSPPTSPRRSIPLTPRPFSVLDSDQREQTVMNSDSSLRPSRRPLPPAPTPIASNELDEPTEDAESPRDDDSVSENGDATDDLADGSPAFGDVESQDGDEKDELSLQPTSPDKDDAIGKVSSYPRSQVRRSIPPPRALPAEPQASDTLHSMKHYEGSLADIGVEEYVPSSHPRPDHTSLDVAHEFEREVLDEADGDPIDPTFHRPGSRSLSPASPQANLSASPLFANEHVSQTDEGDGEQARRRTIAERMAKLGGIKFGSLPPVPRSQRPTPTEMREPAENVHSSAEEGTSAFPEDKEGEELARKARIAAKLAGMGGMRFGMLPPVAPTASVQHSHMRSDETNASTRPMPPPTRRTTAPPPPPPVEIEDPESEDQSVTDSDLVQVEADESELEEVSYEDAVEEVPPAVPMRPTRRVTSGNDAAPVISPSELPPPLPTGRRPPYRPPVPAVPFTPGLRRDSALSTANVTQISAPTVPPPSLPPPHADYVIVDEPETGELEIPPPPPPRSGRGPPSRTILTSAVNIPLTSPEKSEGEPDQGHWRIPDIQFESTILEDLNASTWSEDSTSYPPPADAPAPPPPPGKPPPVLSSSRSTSDQVARPPAAGAHANVQLDPEQLLSVWGRVGVHVSEVAHALHEGSKRQLVGDGTYPGFIRAVLSQVPSAAPPNAAEQTYGHLIYAQTGHTVQRRSSDIMPGDVISLIDAKLKGHKGIQIYHQTVGVGGEPVIGIVVEYEPKKSKVKVFQANQHVGGQTVESMSYRLEDLKSGTVKVFRVAEV